MSHHGHTPTVSVVIPAYNAGKTLPRCLGSLLDQDFDQQYEIIVVDDGSNDGTAQIARSMGVRVIRMGTHSGLVGLLRNTGAENSRGKLLAITDSDMIFPRNWLSMLYKSMGSEKCAMGFTRHIALSPLALPWVKDSENHVKVARALKVNAAGYAGRLAGSNMMIDKATLFEVGGFSTRIRRSTDTELGIRLTRRGIKMRYAPEAMAYHLSSDTFRSDFLKYFQAGRSHAYINRAYGYGSNLPLKDSSELLKLALRILANLTAGSRRSKEDKLRDILRLATNGGYLLGRVCGALQTEYPPLHVREIDRSIEQVWARR